jgi:hypothetical protein
MLRHIAITLLAATAASAQAPSPPRTSRIEGIVLSDFDSAPLRRARVTLEAREAGLTSLSVDADDQGAFVIRNIAAGEYSLVARRDGYLENSVSSRGTLRMPRSFTLGAGQNLTDITFRLRPWGVLSGKIRYDDGDAAVGVRVELILERRLRGRSQFRVATSALTDDHGDYRVYGLAPGAYYVAAAAEREASITDSEEQNRADAQGRELPVYGYSTTFYPDTLKLSEAVSVRVDYGREVGGVDIFLKPVRKVKVRGHVVSGLSGAVIKPSSVLLERMDAHSNGALPAPVVATYDAQSNFEIKGIAPGIYRIWAETRETNRRLIARKNITVSSDDADGVDLIALPEAAATFETRMEGGAAMPASFPWRLLLEPRSERGQIVEERPERGATTFHASLMPEEVYDVFLPNTPNDAYLSAVLVGGTDVRPTGLTGAQAANQSVEVVLDSRGGSIVGRAFSPDNDALSGASVVLIPDPSGGRLQHYRETQADEYGQFQIRGIAPGKYTLVAWLDDPTCDVYDESSLSACRAAGLAVAVEASSQQELVLNMKSR